MAGKAREEGARNSSSGLAYLTVPSQGNAAKKEGRGDPAAWERGSWERGEVIPGLPAGGFLIQKKKAGVSGGQQNRHSSNRWHLRGNQRRLEGNRRQLECN